MNIQSVRESRNMPFLKRGMRVQVFNGKYGRITGAGASAGLKIRLDGEKRTGNYHPQWSIKYFDGNGGIIAEYGD